jgi:hypothetical protein
MSVQSEGFWLAAVPIVELLRLNESPMAFRTRKGHGSPLKLCIKRHNNNLYIQLQAGLLPGGSTLQPSEALAIFCDVT